MSATHTPGPWTVSDERDCGRPWFASVISLAVGIGRGIEVAQLRMRGHADAVIAYKNGEGLANAHLIAAAPELHAMLKHIHSHMACSCTLEPFVGGPVPCETCQIGALITKAEGRTS